MRKLLTILLTALAVALVLVGCSMESKVEDGLALLSFNVNENNLTSKSLTRTNPQLKESDFYWYYTAEKIDNIGLETGETSGQVAVQAGVKGLENVTIGPFSYGLWKFTVYGYAAYDGASGPSKLVYEGSSTLTVNMKSNTLEVTVASKSSGANGTLEFPALGEIAITGTKVSFDVTNFVEKIYIKGMDAANSTVEKTVYNSTERSFSLASGNYSVTVSYLSGATSDNNGGYTGGMTVATDTIFVTIADYLITKVAGTIQENTGSVVVEVSSGVFSATSEVVELKENEESLAIPVAAAPAKKASSSSSSQSGDGQTGGDASGTQGSETTTPAVEAKTTVTVPTSLVEGKVTKASVAVTSYSQEAAASTMPTYTIEGSEEEGSTTLVPLGGLDIDLYVNGSESKTTDFAENQTLTISTVVATGLNGGVSYNKSDANDNTKCSIIVKYNGTGGEDGEVVSYNATTGELTFTVSHLSTYYFVDKDAKVYNQSKNTTYKDLDSAISAATDGDTILLLDCSLSNQVKDEDVSRFNWQVTHNNCSAEAEGYWHEKKSDFYGGYGTKLEPYLIASKEQFNSISNYSVKKDDQVYGYGYYKWYEKDDTLEGKDWPYIYLCGSFDGNGLTINNLDWNLFECVYNNAEDLKPSEDTSNTYTIKNLTINADIISTGSISAVIYGVYVHNFVMENVTVHGYIEGSTHVSSFVTVGPGNKENGVSYGGIITFKNCHSDATIASTQGPATGIIAHPMMTSEGKIELKDSDFTGTLIATSNDDCKYACGNYTHATITDNKFDVNKNTLYDDAKNGWAYRGTTKLLTKEEIDIKTLNLTIGDVISVDAVDDATYALVSLIVSPGPGCYTATCAKERVELSEKTFTSKDIKYFEVRMNPNDGGKTGINGNYYDVMVSRFSRLDDDTIIKFTQYNSTGDILKITEISLGDKTPTETT